MNLEQFSYRGNLLTGSVPYELSHLPEVYVLNLTAGRMDSSQMKLTWDDPVDPTVVYEYRLRDETGAWTEWAAIEDPEPMPQVGNMVTIERTFTDFATDVVYTYISVRPRNGKGLGPATSALVTSSGDPHRQ